MRFDVDWNDVRRQTDAVEALRKEPGSGASLADALGSLADMLEELRSFDRARTARMESLAEYRRFDDAKSRERARRTLTKLREDLVELGELEEALLFAREELGLYRAASGDEHRERHLHDARHAVTTILTSLGRHDEALDSAAAAVRETREMRADAAAMNQEYALAHDLDDYAKRLTVAGRHDEAVSVTKEAVTFWRTKRSNDPSLLVVALEKLASRLADARRLDEADPIVAELLSWDDIEPMSSTWHLANLAASLCNAGSTLARLGLFRGGLAAYETSVVWHRRLIAHSSSRHDGTANGVNDAEVRLLKCLYNLSSMLHTANRIDDALAASTEAMNLARRHSHELLPSVMNNRACLLEAFGDHAAAVDAATEAVSRYSEVENIALARITRSVALSSAGRHDDAVAESSSVLEMLAQLPDGVIHAQAWHEQGLVRSRRGEHAEALAATAEAVRRFEALDRARYANDLAEALVRFAEVRIIAADSLVAAREAAMKAAAIYEPLAARAPEAFAARLGHALKLSHVHRSTACYSPSTSS